MTDQCALLCRTFASTVLNLRVAFLCSYPLFCTRVPVFVPYVGMSFILWLLWEVEERESHAGKTKSYDYKKNATGESQVYRKCLNI